MKLTIDNKSKIDIFVAIFQLLKTFTNFVRLEFLADGLSMQGMDKSHICLFQTIIKKEWFTYYEYNENDGTFFTINATSLFTIISRAQENNTLIIKTNEDSDIIDVELICNENIKGEYNRYFQLFLIDVDQDNFEIPEIDYDADFTLKCKQLHDLTSQLILFGEILEITCSETGIDLFTNGDIGKMKVTIPMEDLNEFSINEGEIIVLSYSLQYIHKMCLTTKLSKDIEISISNNFPIRLKYDLGQESYLYFFIAPKII